MKSVVKNWFRKVIFSVLLIAVSDDVTPIAEAQVLPAQDSKRHLAVDPDQLSDSQELRNYREKISRRIKRAWIPIKDGGMCVVSFEIARDGKVSHQRVVRGGLQKAEIDACLAALKNAEPFPPLPAEFDGPVATQFNFGIGFDANLNKSYGLGWFEPIGIAPKTRGASSGVAYSFFLQNKLRFDFLVARPSTADKGILFCVPAAFTMHDDKVDGVCLCSGAATLATATSGENKGSAAPSQLAKTVNKELGGAIVIEDGKCKLLSTDKGALLTEDFLRSVQKNKSSLFQQFLIVHNGVPAAFRDKSKFQRRAICLLKDGSYSVVESDKAISFDIFNKDLVELGVMDALYLDMGAWDEGWYRSATTGDVNVIGLDRSRTNRQSNWLVLRASK